MTVSELFELNLHDDNTIVEIFTEEGVFNHVLRGNWFQDHILDQLDKPVREFTWKEGGVCRIKLKEVEA